MSTKVLKWRMEEHSVRAPYPEGRAMDLGVRWHRLQTECSLVAVVLDRLIACQDPFVFVCRMEPCSETNLK